MKALNILFLFIVAVVVSVLIAQDYQKSVEKAKIENEKLKKTTDSLKNEVYSIKTKIFELKYDPKFIIEPFNHKNDSIKYTNLILEGE